MTQTPASETNELKTLCEPANVAFSYMPDVAFFVKDLDGRFVMANQSFLRLMGVGHMSGLLGKTDLDFTTPKLARAYMHDDRKVMETGEPLELQVEPVPHARSQQDRIVTTKFPVRSEDGRILGLIGICRNLSEFATRSGGLQAFTKVVSYLESRSFKKYDGELLAKMQGMSKSKFEREFKKLFDLSPAAYHMQARLGLARNDLLNTHKSISEIALDNGFFDQSHFTKRFAGAYGITPLRFRKKSGVPLPLEGAPQEVVSLSPRE